jgi:hypothetical protein
MRKNKSKVCLVKSSFGHDQHFHSTMDCVPLPMAPLLFSRKSLSKYLMDMIDFNKHDINIYINDTWQKYVGDIGRLFKITSLWQLKLRF